MKILAVGATGGTGREVVAQALRRGHEVVALVRRPEQAGELAAGATAVVGDVLDPAPVGKALVGVEGVVCCLGVRLGQEPGTVRSRGTRVLVEQMIRAGVERLVAVSTVGVGSSVADQGRTARMLWPRLIGAERLQEAAAAEAAVVGSTLDWTLVRPPRLIDAPAAATAADRAGIGVGQHLRTGLRSQLGRADLAGVLLDAVEADRWVRTAVTAARG